MNVHRKDDPVILGDVPLEPPPEGEPPESTDTDLPGNGDDDGVDPETKERLRAKVAEERRRQERAELGLPIDEETE